MKKLLKIIRKLLKMIRLSLNLFTKKELYDLAGEVIGEHSENKNIVWQNLTDNFITELKSK